MNDDGQFQRLEIGFKSVIKQPLVNIHGKQNIPYKKMIKNQTVKTNMDRTCAKLCNKLYAS